MFLVYALGCSISFAIHNYIAAVSMTKWRNSLVVLFPEFIPLVLVTVFYHAHRARSVVKPATGKLWTRDRSVFFKKDGTFNSLALKILVARGIAAVIIPVNIAMVSYFSKAIGMSPAVVQSFTTLSSFMTAVCFYFSYKEKLTLQHILGMIMIVGSVLIVAVAKSMNNMVPKVDYIDESLSLSDMEQEQGVSDTT